MNSASTIAGEMMDFLKTHTAFTMHDYLWGLSAPMIKLMMHDATEVLYLSEEQQKEYKNWQIKQNSGKEVYDDPYAFARALNIPIF